MRDESTEIQAVFVVGRHRSGTTWLTNLLVSYGFFSPTSEAHSGQHESAFFSHVVPYFNHGKSVTDRLALYSVFEESDYFLLLGLPKSDLCTLSEKHPAEYFKEVMDKATRKNGATVWVEKTPAHSLYLGELASQYPNALFISVERDSYNVTMSNVYKFSNSDNILDWIKHAVVTEIYKRVVTLELPVSVRKINIRYEDLERSPLDAVESVFQSLGLEPNATTNDISELNNSTFTNFESKPRDKYRQVCQLVFALVNLMPGSLVRLFVYCALRFRKHRLPDWFFKIVAQKES
jgi:hypothetical protein